MTFPLIVQLDKKFTAAAAAGRGVGLDETQVDLLVSLSVMGLLQQGKIKFLEEQARCRD